MAGVIASVSLETRNRENGQKPKRQIHSNKSTYIIPTFDCNFQPSKHNIFFKRSVYQSRHIYLVPKKSPAPTKSQ